MKKILLFTLCISFIYMQGTFSGVTYFNYTYDLTEDAANDDGFALKRVYFTYQQELSEGISYKFQTDVGQIEVVNLDDDDQLDGTKNTQFVAYLKKAQLDWQTSCGKLTFGMQGMNIFNVTEKTWGFRFIEKSPMDKHKFSSSADMWIGVSGKFSNLDISAEDYCSSIIEFKNNITAEEFKLIINDLKSLNVTVVLVIPNLSKFPLNDFIL